MSRKIFELLVLSLAALSLSACVESGVPLITDAKPLLGQQFDVHFYEEFVDNRARDFHAATYQWKDGSYVRASGRSRDAKRFTAESLSANDFIIQSTNEQAKSYLYWIGRRLTPGVYLIFGIDEMNVDEATRQKICGDDHQDGLCRVTTHDQLVTMARATAAARPENAALGVVLIRPASF